MRRNDIHKVLIIGSGPIIIGQACEFDYSGTQACISELPEIITVCDRIAVFCEGRLTQILTNRDDMSLSLIHI